MSTASIAPEQIVGSLKQAMRGLASSVVLISTADADGGRTAMAATSATALTMDPPAMLICINRSVSSYPALLTGADFCINILAIDHLPLARLCSSPARGEARFSEGAWERDEQGVPYLADAQAAIICSQDQRIPYGTHDIFIGKVRGVHLPRGIDPLIYVDGAYKALREDALA
jgi:flavin reductase (DIM6/NTAB) family NADH-FMN oxidoreductase RutF